jgi:hypothetical protein
VGAAGAALVRIACGSQIGLAGIPHPEFCAVYGSARVVVPT